MYTPGSESQRVDAGLAYGGGRREPDADGEQGCQLLIPAHLPRWELGGLHCL